MDTPYETSNQGDTYNLLTQTRYALFMKFHVDFDVKIGVFQEYHILPCDTITFWSTVIDNSTPQMAYFKPGHSKYIRARQFIRKGKSSWSMVNLN